MLGILRAFKEADADDDFFRQWASNAQTFHGTVFGFIESLLVLAALQLAAFATSSWMVWGLYFLGYGTLVLLGGIYFRATFMFFVNRIGITGWPRHAALWISGTGGLIFNIWLVGALSDGLIEIIQVGLANIGPSSG